MQKRIHKLALIAVVAGMAACGGGASTTANNSTNPGGGTGGGATGTATLNWTAPTQNSNGTALTDLAGYQIFQGSTQNTSALVQVATISNPSVSVHVVENLSPGTYYFAVTAVSAQNVQSGFSNLVSITIN